MTMHVSPQVPTATTDLDGPRSPAPRHLKDMSIYMLHDTWRDDMNYLSS